MSESKDESAAPNFVRDIIADDLRSGKHPQIVTRFPPEPNGYLHIGHAKAICVDFGLAKEFGGRCTLRFDDTNPVKEETEFVESIKEDIAWLGFEWSDIRFTSDYFDQLYAWAEDLIRAGKAYVDSQSAEQMKEGRGDFGTPGTNSPYRDRSVEENLDLFRRMKAGEFAEGAHVLRAKIDMASPNMNMRDPALYRILHAHHHRTGDAWHIYPTYDYAHGQSDAIEHVTHSLCTLEFEAHRPLYEWFIDNLDVPSKPRQIEFARLNFTYMVMSKRKLRQLVEEDHVLGWDDPRMPTLSGMRRRGFSPAAIVNLCERVGVSKRNSQVDVSLLEHAVRDDLNQHSPRHMGVMRPLEVVLENFPDDHTEWFEAPQFPGREDGGGTRRIPLTKVVYVEHDDFMEEPVKKWRRLAPGVEVRLRYAALVTCKEVVKNDVGDVVRLVCTWDPEAKGGNPADGRKVKGTIHWVSAEHGVPATVRNYDRLFSVENPGAGETNFLDQLNPDSLEVLEGARVEPDLAQAEPGTRIQFERLGYYCVDPDSSPDALVINRTITLRDSWAKKS
ncbi:MAG: glutamine--tRNA ligase/YqeY domain fusion protein [Nannocystaceae bacterium]|nr:glutamine--tRNA ligase/YqeY domain fusion protein [bacterium]